MEGGKDALCSDCGEVKKPWRVVSVASDDAVATIAFRDDGVARQAVEDALAATTWDDCQEILASAVAGGRPHELSADCWCGPKIEQVTP